MKIVHKPTNSGVFTLDIGKEHCQYRLAEARVDTYEIQKIEIAILTLVGEVILQEPRFVVFLELPKSAIGSNCLQLQNIAGLDLPVLPTRPEASGLSRVWRPSLQRFEMITGGYFQCREATGKGPWDIQGDFELAIHRDVFEGSLKAHLTVLR